MKVVNLIKRSEQDIMALGQRKKNIGKCSLPALAHRSDEASLDNATANYFIAVGPEKIIDVI